MSTLQIVGLVAGVVQLIGYIDYVSFVKKGTINPNTGSWAIWAYGNAIVCWTYVLGGKQISLTETLPIVCSFACFFSGVYFLFRKKFETPKMYEISIFLIDLSITIYWLRTGETILCQILLQISVAISFIPIIMETWKYPDSEQPRPWIIWSFAYGLLLVIELPDGDWWKVIYPAHYLLWHSIMAILSKPPETFR